MKTTVFTGSQPRHLALVERLASVSETVYACMEVTTLFPGQVEDFFEKSDVMRAYFSRVMGAESKEFGRPRFLPENVQTIPMKMGDLAKVDPQWLGPALESDAVVVFGASYIRGCLLDRLIDMRALNIHMGASPYYRGSSCNFWALYDGNPEYVGATIHMLTEGLDSGPMLCHALPTMEDGDQLDGFALGMRAVRVALDTLTDLVKNDGWRGLTPVQQNRSLELRYTRNRDFTDGVAAEYMERALTPEVIGEAVRRRDTTRFIIMDRGARRSGGP